MQKLANVGGPRTPVPPKTTPKKTVLTNQGSSFRESDAIILSEKVLLPIPHKIGQLNDIILAGRSQKGYIGKT